ncbi:hypothetical protein JCM11251_006948 [Rhodosporidiobolus azoricus]
MELLLDILLQLSYEDLLKVEQVSKRLQKLQKDKHFDSALFRQKPAKKLKKGDQIELHPLMHAVNFVYTRAQEAPILIYEGDIDELNAYSYKACDDFVTQPSCTSMRVDMYISRDIRIKNKHGITNRQVFQAIAAFWSRKPLSWMCNSATDGAEEITWADAVVERNGWTGWISWDV